MLRNLFLIFVVSVSAMAQVKIQFWHSMSGHKGKLLAEIVDKFNKSPENTSKINVTAQFVGTYEEGINKLRTALLAKKGPHVAQITDIATQVMIDSQRVVPLQEFIDLDVSFPIKELLLPIRRYYEIGGKLYSLPFATSNPIIYYNVERLESVGYKRPPKTFAELKEYARKLTKPEQKMTGITWPLHSWFFEQFLARQGVELANHSNGRKARATTVNFLSPEAKDFVELWASMVKDGTFSSVGRGWEPAEQNFLAGRAAMLITSTSDVFEIVKKAPFKVMTAPIPKKNENSTGGTIVGGNSLWILKDKSETERRASYEFVKYMASKNVQRRWHEFTGYFPIRKDLIEELEAEGFYRKFPAAKTAIDQLRSSADIPATHGALLGVFAECREAIEGAIEKILSGKMDIHAALLQAKTQTEEALKRYNRGRT